MHKNFQSIVEMNTLPRNRFMGWQFRLDEVQAADDATVKDLARHHVSRAFDQKIDGIRSALERQTRFAKMSKSELKAFGTWQVRNAAGCVFGSWLVMDRLEPGMAAIQKNAGGTLHPSLRNIWQKIWQTLEKADVVRHNFYGADCPDLTAAIGPLCDELESHIIAFYTVAKELYNLPDLDGRIQ